jgi:hypothetical protein
VIEVDDAERISQLMLEMPFSPYGEYEVRPSRPGGAVFEQMRDAMAAMQKG